MSDYDQTRKFSGPVTQRFSKMLIDLQDDYEEEITIVTLLNYYNLCNKDMDEVDKDLLWAIERILQDFMTTHDFDHWLQNRGNGND